MTYCHVAPVTGDFDLRGCVAHSREWSSGPGVPAGRFRGGRAKEQRTQALGNHPLLGLTQIGERHLHEGIIGDAHAIMSGTCARDISQI